MRKVLTERLYELGFLCGIELEIYIQDTSKHTLLIIEGEQKGSGATYRYDFYKQTFYSHYSNKITICEKNMTAGTSRKLLVPPPTVHCGATKQNKDLTWNFYYEVVFL